MKSYGLCNFVESLFSYVVLIFRETLFTCFTWNYMMPSILKNQGVFKINVFSHCFPIKRKSSYDFVVTAWFLMWTSLGLNQGPPDYESVGLTNCATSPRKQVYARMCCTTTTSLLCEQFANKIAFREHQYNLSAIIDSLILFANPIFFVRKPFFGILFSNIVIRVSFLMKLSIILLYPPCVHPCQAHRDG